MHERNTRCSGYGTDDCASEYTIHIRLPGKYTVGLDDTRLTAVIKMNVLLRVMDAGKRYILLPRA